MGGPSSVNAQRHQGHYISVRGETGRRLVRVGPNGTFTQCPAREEGEAHHWLIDNRDEGKCLHCQATKVFLRQVDRWTPDAKPDRPMPGQERPCDECKQPYTVTTSRNRFCRDCGARRRREQVAAAKRRWETRKKADLTAVNN